MSASKKRRDERKKTDEPVTCVRKGSIFKVLFELCGKKSGDETKKVQGRKVKKRYVKMK